VDASSWKCFSTERTRISYLTALPGDHAVVLRKENHTQLTEAATLDRKSGDVEGSAVPRTFRGNVFRQSVARFSVFRKRIVTRSFAKVAPEAARGVIVRYPGGLHPGVNDDRADKFETTLLEFRRDLF
jgi:hypothetical protein